MLIFKFGIPENNRRKLIIAFLCVFVGSFGLGLWLTQINQPWAFFSLPARAWEFAIGGLLALFFFNRESLSIKWVSMLGWLGFGMVCVAAVLFDRQTPFPGSAALVPVIGTVLLIAASHTKEQSGINSMLAKGPMQLIGDMSYSLYLWHWPIFVLFPLSLFEGDMKNLFLKIIILGALSWLTLILVENPIRFNRGLSKRIVKSLALGAALTAVTGLSILGVRGIAAENLEEPLQKLFVEARNDNPKIYREKCLVSQYDTELADCIYGEPDSSKVMVLFGDSHAAHWFPPLERIANESGWKLVVMTKSNCPSALFEPRSQLLGRAYTECTEWREKALVRINSLQPKLVVMSNINSHVNANNPPRLWGEQVDGVLERINKNSERIVIIRDTPRPNRNAPECLSHAVWRGLVPEIHCRLTVRPSSHDEVYNAEQLASESFENVNVIDLANSICDGESCPVYSDGIIKFSDKDHLSETFSLSLWTPLIKALGINAAYSSSN